MTRRILSVPLCVLTVSVLAAPPLLSAESPDRVGARFASSQGFSLIPPQGWIVATRAQREQLAEAVKGADANLLKGLESDRMAVLIFDPDSTSSINVVVAPGRLSLDGPDAPRQFRTGIEDQYRSAGLRIANVRIERRQFGTNDGLLADFENDMSTVADAPFAPRMRQWQAVFVAWGKAYIITCTAPSDSFAKLEPIFTATLASVDFPTTPVAVLRGLPRWMQTALIGALIGALLSLVPMLLKPLFAEAPSQAPASTSLRNEDATKSEKDV